MLDRSHVFCCWWIRYLFIPFVHRWHLQVYWKATDLCTVVMRFAFLQLYHPFSHFNHLHAKYVRILLQFFVALFFIFHLFPFIAYIFHVFKLKHNYIISPFLFLLLTSSKYFPLTSFQSMEGFFFAIVTYMYK